MKVYEKPLFKVMELRLEERIASNSVKSNCAAGQGVGQGCTLGAVWSHDLDDHPNV